MNKQGLKHFFSLFEALVL